MEYITECNEFVSWDYYIQYMNIHIYIDTYYTVFFPYIGNVIIPTDELIFCRGVGQTPTSIHIYIYTSQYVTYISDNKVAFNPFFWLALSPCLVFV